MPDELIELLRREARAMELVEARLRTLELLAAAEEQRFVTVALDELETAAEHLAALEVARALSLLSAGYPQDITATQLAAVLDADGERRAGAVVDGLRLAAERLVQAQERASAVVAGGRDAIVARLEAGGVLAGV